MSTRTSPRPARWLIAGLASGALLAAAAAPAAAAPAPTSLDALLQQAQRPTRAAAPDPDPAAVDRAVRRATAEARVQFVAAATARTARIGSASSRAERRRSRTAFAGLGRADAALLTQQQFHRPIAGAASVPGTSLDGSRLLGWVDDHTARVDPPGPRTSELVVSTRPFRTRGADGRKALVDLTLRRDGGAYTAANPVVDVALPGRSDGTTRVGDVGVTADLGGAASAARPLGDTAVVYPGAGTDADLVASPTMNGLETFFTLRSPSAPERATLRLSLPAGATLLAQEDGSARIVRNGRTVGTVSPPSAVDAQGTSVPTTAAVHGDTITITTAHRGKDVAYPILVDPIIAVDGLDPAPTSVDSFDTVTSLDDLQFQHWYAAPLTGTAPTGMFAVTGAVGDGLYIHDDYTLSPHNGVWRWFAGLGNRIYDVEFDPVTLDGHGDTIPAALFAMVDLDGQTTKGLEVDTANGTISLDREDAEAVSPSYLSSVMAMTFRLTVRPYDHDLYVGGMVAHIEEQPEGPWLDGFRDLEPIEDVVWTNAGADPEPTAIELSATTTGHGVKGFRVLAQPPSGPPIVLGQAEDDCDGTELDPCPDTLTKEFDVDWTLAAEGRYTWKLQTYDADGRTTSFDIPIGIDRTPPTLDPLSGPAAALDGTTTASTATLDLYADASEVADLVSKSGLAELHMYGAAGDVYVDCTVDACDPATFEVALGSLGDGHHAISVTATDLAQNDTTRRIDFDVDRTP
jgi:hypothetical protein